MQAWVYEGLGRTRDDDPRLVLDSDWAFVGLLPGEDGPEEAGEERLGVGEERWGRVSGPMDGLGEDGVDNEAFGQTRKGSVQSHVWSTDICERRGWSVEKGQGLGNE